MRIQRGSEKLKDVPQVIYLTSTRSMPQPGPSNLRALTLNRWTVLPPPRPVVMELRDTLLHGCAACTLHNSRGLHSSRQGKWRPLIWSNTLVLLILEGIQPHDMELSAPSLAKLQYSPPKGSLEMNTTVIFPIYYSSDHSA